MRTLNLLAFVALVSGGCVVVHDNGGGGGGGGGGGTVGGPATYRIDPGFSTVVLSGSQPGYGITANLGGSYRAVWTGDASSSGTYREFTGSIYTPGTFTAFTPGCDQDLCALEANDLVNPPEDVAGGGQQITFDTVALDGLDGLDFGVSLEPVEFDLRIDGVAYPNLVFYPDTDLGGQITSPASNPFDLTTN